VIARESEREEKRESERESESAQECILNSGGGRIEGSLAKGRDAYAYFRGATFES
jgi:hypothetical protein